jgi:hypothetical protein
MALSSVDEMKLVASNTPLRLAVDVGKKFVPLTVTVVSVAPAAITSGEIALIVGAGLLTTKSTAFDVPPPGEGFVTATGYVPADAWSLALSEMVN